MSSEIVVTDRRSGAIEHAPEPNASLLGVMQQLALNPSLDADKIEKLFNIFIDGQRKMQEMADEKAFADGMAEFKKNPPDIVKNRKATVKGTAKGSGREYSYEYSYADLDAYCKEAMPQLAQYGITWSFPFAEDAEGRITVSCILRYGLYSHTPTTLSGLPEGGNNPLQAKGVTVSYLERYTFCGATGLTAAMPDKDGSTVEVGIRQEEGAAWVKKIEDAATAEEAMKAWTDAVNAAKHLTPIDYKAMTIFTEARDERLKTLRRAK